MSIDSLICDECVVRGQLMGSHLRYFQLFSARGISFDLASEAVVLIIGAESPVYSCPHRFF
jgi:hypothetical protein